MSEAIVSPVGRILYVQNLWKARRFQNNPTNAAKYGCAVVITKNPNDPVQQALIAAFNVDALTIDGTLPPQFAGGMATLPYGKKSCLMEGSVRHPGDAFYADKLILSASKAEEDGQPQVLSGPGQPIMDKGELYSGADAMLHVRFYVYGGGTGGLNAELLGAMKVGDNEKLGHTDPDSSAAFAAATGQPVQQPVQQPPLQPAPGGFAIPGQPVQQPYPVQQQPLPAYAAPIVPGAPVYPAAQPIPVQPVQQQPLLSPEQQAAAAAVAPSFL